MFDRITWLKDKLIVETVALEATTIFDPLFKISTVSPTFKLDLSIALKRVKVDPETVETWYLELVL